MLIAIMTKLVYADQDVDMDEYVNFVAAHHAKETPFWTKYQETNRFDLEKEINCIDDLRKLPYFPDNVLRVIPAEDLVPRKIPPEERVLSVSSGTTGEQKRIYWWKHTIDYMVKYAEYALNESGFPYNELWVCTGPKNDLFKIFLRDLSECFNGSFHYIEVDASAAKKAFMGKDPAAVKEFFDSVSGEVEKIAMLEDIGVYEDIAPLMAESARRLPEEKRKWVKGLLLGGVETTPEKIEMFGESFPNAAVSGWYGDFMNGTGMIREFDRQGITYQPFFPYAVLEVRDIDSLDRRVSYGERGEVVSHRLGPDIFIPNRRVGDEAERARPVEPLQWDGVRNVTRLSTQPGQSQNNQAEL